MEDKLQIFNNVEFGQIRTVIKDNVVWFVGKDVAEALGYSDTNKAVAMHVDEEDKQLNDKTSSSFGQRGATIINESGLYSLVLSSKLPSAKKFKRWVTSEILPSIRKTGSYIVKKNQNEDLKLRRLNIMEENARARRLKAENDRAKLWLELSEKTNRERVKQISEAYTANTLAGQRVLELPKVEKMTYSAEDIGKIFGVSASKIGRIANKHHLKTKEYGDYFMDKARYANKEVQTFRYYENAIEVFRSLLGGDVA